MIIGRKEVKRVIYVDELTEVDYDNFGNHFTSNVNYSHKGGGSAGMTRELKYKISFYCKYYKYDELATEFSNENYPKEKEVVLVPNQTLKGGLSIMQLHNGKEYKFVDYIPNFKLNTGNRVDRWVNDLHKNGAY